MTETTGFAKRPVIFILAAAALGMLFHGMAWLATLLYQLPWLDVLRTFPLSEEVLEAFIGKARFYSFVQMLFHGILFTGAYLLLRNKPKGKWVVLGGGAMTLLTTIFLPMIFPAADPAVIHAEGAATYADLKSNLIVTALLWAGLWVAVLYYLQWKSRSK